MDYGLYHNIIILSANLNCSVIFFLGGYQFIGFIGLMGIYWVLLGIIGFYSIYSKSGCV